MTDPAQLSVLAKAQIVALVDELIRETDSQAYRSALISQRNRVAKLLDQPVRSLKEVAQERNRSSARDLAVDDAPS